MGKDLEETYYGLPPLILFNQIKKMKIIRYNANLKLIGRRLYGKV